MSNLPRICLLLTSTFCVATQLGAGCVSDTSSGPTRSSPSSSGRDRDEDSDYIPQRADIVAEGKNELRWTADADGQLYVQDLRDEKKVYEHRVTRGTVIRVSPDEDRIWINDKTVSKSDLKRDHAHRIYIERDRRFDNDSRMGRQDREEKLPSSAKLITEGRNRELTFTAGVDGRVYIYDNDARRVVNSAAIERGQKFVFSPNANKATIDGKRVVDQSFDSRKTYRIYLAR